MSAFTGFVTKVKLHAETQRMIDSGEYGRCCDCDIVTDRKVDDDDWQCEDCSAEATRERASEDFHNDNRRF